MKDQTTEPTMSEALGISKERFDAIKSNISKAASEFLDNDEMQRKSDAIKLAIAHCKPETYEEAVMIGMALEAALTEFSNPLNMIRRLMQK